MTTCLIPIHKSTDLLRFQVPEFLQKYPHYIVSRTRELVYFLVKVNLVKLFKAVVSCLPFCFVHLSMQRHNQCKMQPTTQCDGNRLKYEVPKTIYIVLWYKCLQIYITIKSELKKSLKNSNICILIGSCFIYLQSGTKFQPDLKISLLLDLPTQLHKSYNRKIIK